VPGGIGILAQSGNSLVGEIAHTVRCDVRLAADIAALNLADCLPLFLADAVKSKHMTIVRRQIGKGGLRPHAHFG